MPGAHHQCLVEVELIKGPANDRVFLVKVILQKT